MHEPRQIGTDLNIGVLFAQSDGMVCKIPNQTECAVSMTAYFHRSLVGLVKPLEIASPCPRVWDSRANAVCRSARSACARAKMAMQYNMRYGIHQSKFAPALGLRSGGDLSC